MTVDFKKLKSQAVEKAKIPNNSIFAIVLGVRGSGKSGTAAGTWGKRPTLLVYLSKEHHSKDSAYGVAKKLGHAEYITPYNLNEDEATGEMIDNPDKIFTKLITLLDDPNITKEFEVFVFDGLSAFDPCVYMHTEVAKASTYDKSKKQIELYDRVISKLKALHYKGMDVVVTCATEARFDMESGGIVEQPKLRGTGACDSVIGEFSELLHIGLIDEIDEETGVVTREPKFQFGTNMKKEGKKFSGETVRVNFNPRIAQVHREDIPSIASASMEALKKFKGSKK